MGVTDFDAPRATAAEPETESLELLQERRGTQPAVLTDPDLTEEPYELPVYEIVEDELTAPVVPVQSDEFRCMGCFLVLHRTLLAEEGEGDHALCRDCV